MPLSDRAELYTALAEVLAEPAQWICLPGREWPLFELASRLLPNSSALPGLVLIQPEPLAARQARFRSLNGPRTWLSESAFLTGRFLGEATFVVAKCYSKAGLQVEGSELPDGAATELAFLAHLAQNDPVGEIDFLKQHAGRWLPALGRAMAGGPDPLYAAIGQLLSDWIAFAISPAPERPKKRELPARLPVLVDAPACSLCGFCAQRCPAGALSIRETDRQTELVFVPEHCTGCGRCAAVCDRSLLSMIAPQAGLPAPRQPEVLRISERVPCRSCGQPTVSRAELDYVIGQIGHLAWLDYCPACRVPAFMHEKGQ